MSDIYNSKLANFLLKFKKNATIYAITTSKDVCRYSCLKENISEQMKRHEEVHKKQFKKYGWFKFILLYCLEYVKNGYHDNKFEIEARKAE